MSFDRPGPELWDTMLGIGSFEEFKTVMEGFVPSIGPLNIPFTTEVSLRLAYEEPLSPLGAYLMARATAAGYDGSPSETSTTTVALSVRPWAELFLQEAAAMPTLVIPDAFQITIHATSGGQAVDNVFGVVNAGGSAAGAAAAALAAWKVATGPLSLHPSAYVMVSVTAVDLSSADGDIAVVNDTTAGSLAAALSTNAACALVKWNGGTRSKSSRGRLYHGPLTEAQINSDGRTLAVVASMTTAYNAFKTSLAGAGYPLAVLSRKLQSSTLVSVVAVESVIATQRRRIRD